MPQLVNTGRLAGRDALGQLDEATHGGPPRNSVLRCLSFDPDDANAGVLWATVVLAITKITNPGLQSWGVVLLDNLAVGLDRSVTGDRGPLARGVDEADVD